MGMYYILLTALGDILIKVLFLSIKQNIPEFGYCFVSWGGAIMM